MTDRLPNATKTPKEPRIGIPVKLRQTTDGVELQPRELERLRVQEAHLRATLARTGLTLTPLGYIEGACVQYAAQRSIDSATRPGNVEGPIHQQLDGLIEDACAARKRLIEMAESAVQPPSADIPEVTVPGASETTTIIGVADEAVGGRTATATSASEPAASTLAPPHGDDEALVRDIQHGPDVITIDGRPMQWSNAVPPIDAPDVGARKTIECTVGEPEHYFVDVRGQRYRIPESCDADQLDKGARVRVDHIRTERVFATTMRRQRDLVFGGDG